MKKLFFFLLLFLSFNVNAETIKHFEVLNGKLSIPFDSKVNDYTVYLVDGETKIKANYNLIDEKNTVEIKEDNEKAIYTVFNNNEELEKYTFYKNIKEDLPVFNENISPKTEEKEIKNLALYVFGTCAIIIVILFKVIVLGFKKKHKI